MLLQFSVSTAEALESAVTIGLVIVLIGNAFKEVQLNVNIDEVIVAGMCL